MKARATLTLVLLAVGLFAFIFYFERHAPRTVDANRPGRVLPDLNPVAVTSVQVRPAGQLEIFAERTAASWRITQPIAANAQTAGVENLLQLLAQQDWQSRLTPTDLADRANATHEFGFAPPQFSIAITQDGHQRELKIGNRTALGDEVYLRVGDADDIYLANASLLKSIPSNVNDWRDPLLVNLKNLAFDRLIVTNGAKIFELQRDATNKLWRVTRPLDARADNPKIEALLAKLGEWRVSRFVTDDPKADLDSFGLQPPALEISLALGAKSVLDLQFGKSPTNDATQVYVRRGDLTGVGLIAGDLLTPWRGTHEDFRDRHLLDLTGTTVDEIELRGAESFTVHRQSNDVWRVTAPDNLPADSALINDLLNGLSRLQVAQFVKTVVTEPDLPNYGLAPAATQFVLKTGPTNAVIAQLDFSVPADGKVSARRSDETSVYAVLYEDLRRLLGAGWQLRERRLWDFTEENVTRLALTQRGQTRELIRSGTNNWGFATNSQGVINNFAVEETVHRLGELFADGWVDRGETNRARYGFDTNALQLAVDVKRADKKIETLNLEFSGVTPTRPPYGAVQLDGQPWFFELSPALGEMVRTYLCLPPATP
jgi:hypothetical protein